MKRGETRAIRHLNLTFNNMHKYALSQLFRYEGFKFFEYLSMFTFDFVMNYNEESNIGYTLMVDVEYPVYLQPLDRDLSFLPEKRVINRANKLVRTFYDKQNYACQIGLSKQSLIYC